MKLFIHVKHLSILIVTDEDELIKKLHSEFHYFTSGITGPSQYEIRLHRSPVPSMPEMEATKILPHAVIYHHQGERYIDYQGKALIHQQHNVFHIYTEDNEFLFELAFLTIHSLLGDMLQELGFYRIHALAGTYHDRDFLLLLPSGGGKSSMLAEFLKDPSFKIISDDSPLIDQKGILHPFPTKISMSEIPDHLEDFAWFKFSRSLHSPKFVLSLSHFSEKVNTHPSDKRPLLILGSRSSFKTPHITHMNRLSTGLSLLENMIIGVGLPQVIEIFLSFRTINDIFKMGKAFFKRALAAYHLYLRTEHYRITLSVDITANCQKVKDLIDEISSR